MLKPGEHRFGGLAAEAGDVAAHGRELRPGKRALLDVVEANQAEIGADAHPGLRESREHAKGDEVGEADRSLDLRMIGGEPKRHVAAERP